MINFDFDHHCTGCAACSDICPQHCISMTESKHGFIIPHITTEKCTNCGLCDRVCPVLNVNYRENPDQRCYCSYHLDDNIRREGSSGSMFYLIAEWVISQGGVVFGAAFDKKLQLHHICVTTINDLKPLMKSKYLQSNTEGIYVQVRNRLREGRKVLFVGTPCQCQALYNSISFKLKEHLYLIDFMCHGVPSQNLFNRYIKSYEKKHDVSITGFSFRHKPTVSNGNEEDIRHYRIESVDRNGKVYIDTGLYHNCSFYVGFKKYQIFRNSCYECRFVGDRRITDFTLGDFWHLTEFDPDVNDFYNGYSQFIVNSDRAHSIFEALKSKIYYKQYDMIIPMTRNHAYSKPTVKTAYRDIFFSLYNICPYNILSWLFWGKDKNVFRKSILKILRLFFYIVDLLK